MARALGISKSAVSQWPEELTQDKVDRVTGAAIRLGKLPSGDRRDRDRTTANGQEAAGERIRESATEAGAAKTKEPEDTSGEAA